MEDLVYSAVIALNPKTKKNSQRIVSRKVYKKALGKFVDVPFIIQSKDYVEYEEKAGWFLLKRPPVPINRPVTVKVLFYRKDRIRCDLTNLLEAVDDILVKYRVLADDNYNVIVSHDGSRVYVDPKKSSDGNIYILLQ